MKKELLDLVALSKLTSEHCYTTHADGTKTPEFKRLTIHVKMGEDKTKVYHINRSHINEHTADPNMIDTYTIFPDDEWGINKDRSKRTKWYTHEGLDKKLISLAKEIHNKEFTIKHGY